MSKSNPALIFCCARTRSGRPCRRWALAGKRRCPLHGGLSTGATSPDGKQRQADGRLRYLHRLYEQGRKPGPAKGTGGRPRARAARPVEHLRLDALMTACANDRGRRSTGMATDRSKLDRLLDTALAPSRSDAPSPANPSIPARPGDAPAPPLVAAAPDAPASQPTPRADLPDRLERTVEEAITQADHILALPLDRDHPQYAAELRAKTAVINTALSVQARVDDMRLRRQVGDGSALKQLLEEIKEAKAKNPRLCGPPMIDAEPAKGAAVHASPLSPPSSVPRVRR